MKITLHLFNTIDNIISLKAITLYSTQIGAELIKLTWYSDISSQSFKDYVYIKMTITLNICIK